MNEDLDILEKEIISAITKCSVFDFQTVKYVYIRAKSFDKTIEILKLSVSQGIPVNRLIF